MSGFRQAVRGLLRLITANRHSLQRSTPWNSACDKAEDRGFQLLVDNLSPSQREQYQTYGHFEVTGGDTGKRYRIWHGYQMNVEELDHKGHRVRLLCFTPKGDVPVSDIVLTQKIALELFETDAVRVANRTPWNAIAAEARMVRRNLRF